MDILALLGSALGLGMMAGLNLYATVLAIGFGVRFGVIHLNPSLSHLQILAEPWMLGIAGVAFLVEFFADKIPWLDSLWDGFHTLIRPLGAAFLGAAAVGTLDPSARLAVGIVTGGVALTGHTTKAGTRLAVNHSPEPFSNIALSLGEDAFAIFGTWVAIQHPFLALGVVVAFLLLFAVFAPVLFRLLRLDWTALAGVIRHWMGYPPQPAILPEVYRAELPAPPRVCLHAIAGRGVRGLRNSSGYLCLTSGEIAFFTIRWFRRHARRVSLQAISASEFRTGVLLDSLILQVNGAPVVFLLPKDQRPQSRNFADSLRASAHPQPSSP